MSKIVLKTGLILATLVLVLAIVLKNAAEDILLETVQNTPQNTFYLGFLEGHFETVAPVSTCFFSACVQLENVELRTSTHHISLGDVLVRWPLKYPFRLELSGQKEEKTIFEALLFQESLELTHLDIQDGAFQLVGRASLKLKPQPSIEGVIEATGLWTFLGPYLPPQWALAVHSIVSDVSQVFWLGTEEGWVTVNQWRLMPLTGNASFF